MMTMLKAILTTTAFALALSVSAASLSTVAHAQEVACNNNDCF